MEINQQAREASEASCHALEFVERQCKEILVDLHFHNFSPPPYGLSWLALLNMQSIYLRICVCL